MLFTVKASPNNTKNSQQSFYHKQLSQEKSRLNGRQKQGVMTLQSRFQPWRLKARIKLPPTPATRHHRSPPVLPPPTPRPAPHLRLVLPERAVALEQFVEHAAVAEPVGAAVVHLTLGQHLRRHVPVRPAEGAK